MGEYLYTFYIFFLQRLLVQIQFILITGYYKWVERECECDVVNAAGG